MRDRHRRPARRRGGRRHHAAAARRRTPDVSLHIRHPARRRRRQQSGTACGGADDRRRARRLRMVDVAATDGAFRRWLRRSPTHRPIPRLSMSIDAGLQVLLVGTGASLGREGAPRQLAAALGDFGTIRLALTARDREILLSCAAGAGLGAVYSVPLGGALFAAQILLGTLAPPRPGHGPDHLESRGRGCCSRHSSRTPAVMAGREDCPICSGSWRWRSRPWPSPSGWRSTG